ncbi:hypothetical protein AWB70_02209 [Caballeronia cordobensis]|uniref:Lipoprotein n=1 Tax=Caballeronia cordobensis TaxID=1353886 RepID=A0A158GP09_CABCO|nr:hypothetical protein [Caballeronia cordobensis]SAL33349.1 hypothetical protein AWB70_02209 [Caballeronia cordobensis]
MTYRFSKTHRVARAAALSAAIVVAACGQFTDASRDDTNNASKTLTAEIPYYLPKAVFMATVTRELLECDVSKPAPKAPSATLRIIIKTSIVWTSRIESDMQREKRVSLVDLQGALKTVDASIDLSTDAQTIGMLKSVNVQTEDKTAAIIGNLVGSAIKVALIANPISPKVVNEKNETESESTLRKQWCGAEAIAALDEIARLEGGVSAVNVRQLDATATSARIKSLKDKWLMETSDVTLSPYPAPSTPVNPADAAVTEGRLKYLPLRSDTQEKWLTAAGRDKLKGKMMVDKQLIARDLVVGLLIDAPQYPSSSAAIEPSTGLFYLQPAAVKLIGCRGECFDDSKMLLAENERLSNIASTLPQLGRLVEIPLKGGMFAGRTVGLSFDSSGAVSKITFKSDSAAANAAESLNSALGQVQKYVQDRHEANKRDQEADPPDVQAMKQEKERLDAQKALLDAQAAVTAPPSGELTTKQIEEQTARYKALKGLVEAKSEYDAALKQ